MRGLTLVALLCVASVVTAQDQETVRIAVRVSSLGSGDTVSIDRGSGSHLELDDLVRFQPRDGLPVDGVITELEDRNSVVTLFDLNLAMAVGTRGYVQIPRERYAVRKPKTPVRTPSNYTDDAWRDGMPLLAGIEAVDPGSREPQISGYNYFILDQTWTTDQGRKDSFYRAGTDLAYENPFGRGGRLQFDAEYSYRAAHSGEMAGEDFTRLRFDRASYLWGGDRFRTQRREVGRFLLNGMPEFGVIDGIEFGHRTQNGDRFGYSVGFLPEPTGKFQSGNDSQISAFYEWHPENREALAMTFGIQRTFHGTSADRDLIVAKASYRPRVGWDFYGTAWIDLYTAKDANKPIVELTRLSAIGTRRYGSDGGMTVAFRHWTFPEINRFEFLPVVANQLANDRSDRISFAGWRALENRRRWHGELGLWNDEDESGADLELGIEQRDLYVADSRADLTGFLTAGQFSRIAGLRGQYDWKADNGRWRLFYSIENQQQVGFNDLDELIQHWLRASRDFYTQDGWSLNLRGETLLFGDETSWSIGAYIQRSF